MSAKEKDLLEDVDVDLSNEIDKSKSGFLTKILIIAGMLAVQVIAAYFGIQYFFFDSAEVTQNPVAVEEEFQEVGPILQLDEIVVNPSGSLGRRFLVVKIALELMDVDVQENIERQMPLINDGLIKILSSKNIEYLSNIASRDSLREDLRVAINDRLPAGEGVSQLYFTGFVLQ